MKMYNSAIPPDYPLEKVTLPMAIFHGVEDYLANPKVRNINREKGFKFKLLIYI